MSINNKRILWIDDEIELLKSHIMYLKERQYEVFSATNGPDAIEMIKRENYDAVLLDEMMPVMGGLDVLKLIKEVRSDLPVIMVTENEAEDLMEQAIGSQIAAFLTKPVNPSQILSVLKTILERRKISEEQFTRQWAEEFSNLSRLIIDEANSAEAWADVHLKLCNWELKIGKVGNDLADMVNELRHEANINFSKWVEDVYIDWLKKEPTKRSPLSMDVLDRWLLPVLNEKRPTLFLVVDCLRLDQWLTIEPLLAEHFDIKRDVYSSIIPTSTPYARNALFSGLMPSELERVHNDLWEKGDEDEASSNRFERQFMDSFLARRDILLKPALKYVKVLEADEASEFERRISDYIQLPLTAMVYNFVDILVHSRQSVEVLKEMLPDEAAFRSVTHAWFQHSSLFRIMKSYAAAGGIVVLTSDHGSIRVKRGSRVVGDKQTSSSLRFKYGKNLQTESKHSIKIKNPDLWGLPKRGINSDYIISKEDYYFVYPTNYNKYLDLYKNSFQHGGISLEEMMLPVVTLRGK